MRVELQVYIQLDDVPGVNEYDVEQNAREIGHRLLDSLPVPYEIEQVIFGEEDAAGG